MGKINGCLKCLFIFFNVLYAIIGCVLMYGAVKLTAYSLQLQVYGSPGLGWIWVFAIGVLAISSLGIFAGCSEKALVLKIFAGFMVVGMVIMMIIGIVVVVKRNKVRNDIQNASSEFAKTLMAKEEGREMLNGLQQSAQCCGVASPREWGDVIPDSCQCSSADPYRSFSGGNQCGDRPSGTTGPNQIYKQTCSEIIDFFVNLGFTVAMAFFFGFAVTALLGLLLSLLMIHQVRRHDIAGGASIPMKGY